MYGAYTMKVETLSLEGLKLIELKQYHDHRGFFTERFNNRTFTEIGLPNHFVQDNHSRSHPQVIRGLHFQNNPAQGKLVGVIRGKIWDVAVDVRPDSPTFGKHIGVELSDENGKLLWIPAGFAHGFCVLGDEPADVFYKVDAIYNPTGETGICWNDEDLAIAWPVQNPIVSDRDKSLQSFASYCKKLAA